MAKASTPGEALRDLRREGLDRIFEKYFSNPIEATVTFSKQGYRFHAAISVHVGRGILMQAEDDGGDAYVAFDITAETISKRLRRHKRRLRDHHRAETDSYAAKQFVLAADVGDEAALGSGEAGDHANGHSALIVAELRSGHSLSRSARRSCVSTSPKHRRCCSTIARMGG